MTVLACSTACKVFPEDTAPTRLIHETSINYSHYWRPTSHLSLDSAEATFVRAFIESDERGKRAADEKAVYPGFTHVPSGQFRSTLESQRFWFYGPATPDSAGKMVWWIHDYRDDGPSFQVLVCQSYEGMSFRHSHNIWTRAEGPGSPYGARVTVARTGNTPPSAAVAGPSNIPTTDVFGSWTVPLYDEFSTLCPHNNQPTTEPTAAPLPGKPENPPPSPGWPA